MDSQFSPDQLQSRSHALSQPQAPIGHHGPHIQFHQVHDAHPQASFPGHHHHHHPDGLSGLPGMNVVEDAVFPSDLHNFQGSFETVPQSGVVVHQTGAVVQIHNGFDGVNGLPILLDRGGLLSQPREHSVELRRRQGTPQPQHGRKQLPPQRPAMTQPQGQRTAITTAQLTNATTSQGSYGMLASSSLPEAKTVTRIRDEARNDFPGALAGSDNMTDIETPVADTRDMGVQDVAGVPGEQLKKQTQSQLSTKMVLNPPNLALWRQRLFDLEDIVVLSHDEFETYFPHVDNVYSHRSTQRYKRKPFVTHYWDCRMKGRPPGTPKSDDPNKKKRKRHARERDLCDVKIKITEYAAEAAISELAIASNLGPDVLARVHGQRFWTLQRVNGNGTNGTGDGKPATHKHSLEKSDEIKKNSIQRLMAAREKNVKTPQKPPQAVAAVTWKPGAWKPTGLAALTAKKHSKVHDIKLYAACFCPFSQRVWIALEVKGLAYQYCEMDPFKSPKPTHLLEANPRGQVPAIRHGEWACGESTVILEYLEDLDNTVLLYPTNPRLKATCRLWIDFLNKKIVPAFYGLLSASDGASQDEGVEQLQQHIKSIVQAADEEGPYFLGDQMCLVDVHFAPFALRLSRILEPFRGWTPAVPETRWQQWIAAMEDNPHVRNTMSSRSLYTGTMDLLVKECRA